MDTMNQQIKQQEAVKREQERFMVNPFGSMPGPDHNQAADASAADGSTDDPNCGMDAEIKHFYRKDSKQPWIDWAPDTEKLDEERLKNAKFAILVRREQDTDAEDGFSLHSLTIQSPILREMLSEVFDGSQGVNTKLRQITLSAPFHDLFYRWERYEQCLKNITDAYQLQHAKLLDSVVRPQLLPLVELTNELKRLKCITFELLWTLFEPQSVIYENRKGQDRLYEAQSSNYCSERTGVFLSISCRHVDYDGATFGYRHVNLAMDQFKGYKRIVDLNVLPIDLHPSRDAINLRVLERGERFESLQGCHYLSYSGLLDPAEYGRRPTKVHKARVMIDSNTFLAHHPDMSTMEPLNPTTSEPSDKTVKPRDLKDELYAHTIALLTTVGSPEGTGNKIALNDRQHRLSTSIVKGYCLTSKQWVYMEVDGVHDIVWNSSSFKRLYLPQDHKELILAFVESHLAKDNKFDDIVHGKGKGMVMLLSGVPGVGKTLTAEAVAEEMKRPLYSMSAAQLGPNIEAVEETLQDVLEICAGWEAVLLIDEADVFLERRQMTDIHRNKLVSIFLRLLEYYQGAMFLTTNRVLAFDAAFKSRIDLHIDYPKLDEATKKHIWQTFVTPSEDFTENTSTLTDEDLDVLKKLDINGREIKNMVKTGRLLARRKGEELGMQHLRTVLSVQSTGPVLGQAEDIYPPLD